EVVGYNEYWIDIYNEVIDRRYNHLDNLLIVNKDERNVLLYNLLMVYDRGDYIVYDGWESWLDYYNLTLGSKVIAVDDVPIHEAVSNSFERSYLFYDYSLNRSYIQFLAPSNLGLSPKFTIENTTSEIVEVNLFSNYSINYPSLNWRGFYPALENVDTRLYPTDRVGYLQVSQMAYDPSLYYNQIMTFYDQIENYDHLIIDIRGNPGGNDYFWYENIVEPLLKENVESKSYIALKDGATYSHILRKENNYYFKKSKNSFDYLPPEVLAEEYKIYKFYSSFESGENPVAFDGEISVLVDKYVYSSAEAFSVFCKNTGFATLYGTNTGGDGIGHQFFFVLPHSKLVIKYSFALGLFESGHANQEIHTSPDVYYQSAAGNWEELIDFTINDLTS
ncbi:MAG: hypothetical protein FK733_19165, partial [Asgard group archaeon]|nr:hypothetical protein [Asgard group archaeon]